MNFPLVLGGEFILKMTDEELERLSRDNKIYKFEREADGSLTVQEPVGRLTSKINCEINRQLANWNFEHKLGEVADSSGGFTLPDHSVKSPDAAWTCNERIPLFEEDESSVFAKVCPDFVVELKSKTDSIKHLKLKMKMWIQNGCRLGWLIDPQKEVVYIFSGTQQSMHSGFDQPLSGEPVLPEFTLILSHLRMK